MLGAVRVGRHVFARNVLANCGNHCVFCGFSPASFGGKKLVLAGHIKPWKDSTPGERLDPRNGLAACPAHNVAFDTGMTTVKRRDAHSSRLLARGRRPGRPPARQFYGQPPLRQAQLLPISGQPPASKYLDWHREKIFSH